MEASDTPRVDDVLFARSGIELNGSPHDPWITQLMATTLGFLIGLGIGVFIVDHLL